MVVTSAKRNVLMQLGGRKAIDVVRELVNDLSEDERTLLSSGLFIGRVVNEYKGRFGRGDFLIRNVLGVDQNSGAVAVGDALRVGQTVQFHLRDADTAAEDLELLLQSEVLKDPAAAAMLCTCSGRGRNLFEEPNYDASAVTRWLSQPGGLRAESFPLAGFFAGGEIGPIGDHSYVHGHTASLAIFRPGSP
jgi:small ligand-binding sensory domain FIST